MKTPKEQPIWWERCAALAALIVLVAMVASSQMSCGGPDLIISGQFPPTVPPTSTGAATGNPTATETPDPDEEG